MRNHLYIFFTFLYLVFGMSVNSYAAAPTNEGGKLADTLCAVVKGLTGTMGKAVATIAIIALAIGLFLGKLSWGLALATALGIGMIFGGASVIEWLTGSTAATC